MNFYIRVAQEVALLFLEKMLPIVEIKEKCWFMLDLVSTCNKSHKWKNELKPFEVE